MYPKIQYIEQLVMQMEDILVNQKFTRFQDWKN